MTIVRSISRVILFVADPALMMRFYRDVTGLAVIDDGDPGFVMLGGNGCQLALHRIPDEYLSESEANAPREDSYVKFVFYSDDVESDRGRLVAAGARMREIQRYNGLTFCDGADPEGNVFQISSRV